MTWYTPRWFCLVGVYFQDSSGSGPPGQQPHRAVVVSGRRASVVVVRAWVESARTPDST
jgi:hypothetical protein